MRRFMLMMLALLAAMLLAAGCGDDEATNDDTSGKDAAAQTDDSATTEDSGDDAAAAGGQTIELGVVSNELKFDETKLTAKAGTVTIKLVNPDAIPHNVAIKDGDTMLEEGELVSNGDVSEITVDLEAGKTYTYVCTPHEGAGMTGELTVS